jgi:phosphoglycolate phosphatase
MQQRYSGLVFDLDGTLIDSAPTVSCILNEMRCARDLPPLPLQQYKSLSSEGGSVLIESALEVSPRDAEKLVQRFRQYYLDVTTPIDCVYPDVFNLLDYLVANGFRLAICSNKPEKLCLKVLEDTGLRKYFDAVIGGDTLVEKKPNPTPLLKATSLIGKKARDILFVGDSSIDQQTASAAAVRFAFHSSGYGPTVDSNLCEIKFCTYSQFFQSLRKTIET